MSPTETLRAAATLIRDRAGRGLGWIAIAPTGLAEPLADWLEHAAEDLSAATVTASKLTHLGEDFDPIEFCDEPDSVRRALTLAATILGRTQ